MKNRINKASNDTAMFVTWEDGNEASKKHAMAVAGEAMMSSEPIIRNSSTYASDVYKNILPNISVRDGYGRQDYEAFRPDEMRPTNYITIIYQCMQAYRHNGLIKNIIDLMADFASQGAKLVHPNKQKEKFYQEWWYKVDGVTVTERFTNYLLRCGQLAVKRQTAKLRQSDVDDLQRGFASPDIPSQDIERPIKPERNEIPWKYSFLNPLGLDLVGDDLAMFAGQPSYALRVPEKVIRRIKNPSSAADKAIVNSMPSDIVTAIRNGAKKLPLDPNKVSFYFYKKDDWALWADPMIYSIIEDIHRLEKMKRSDLAAMDAIISHIRIWKVGSLDPNLKLLPTPAVIQRLSDILINNVGGGAMDLIWGPAIELDETSTEIYKLLASDKYGPVLNDIYAGIGIPQSLTGSTQGGMTNNYMSLKTLVERLKYIRQILTRFWEYEISLVQLAMGHRFPAQIQFDHMNLSDEVAVRQLLLQLADRDILSLETIQERLGEIPEIQQIRLKREADARAKGRMPRKSGPWHNPEQDEALQKIALQTGVVTPSEVGLELDEKKKGEVSALTMKQKAADKAKKNAATALPGVAGKGRPGGSKDSAKRKQKTIVKKTAKALNEAYVWARAAQEKIAEIINPVYLSMLGKNNLRALSNDESTKLENFSYAILCNLDVHTDILEDYVLSLIEHQIDIPTEVDELYRTACGKYSEKYKKQPTLQTMRELQAQIYAMYKGDIEDGESSD